MTCDYGATAVFLHLGSYFRFELRPTLFRGRDDLSIHSRSIATLRNSERYLEYKRRSERKSLVEHVFASSRRATSSQGTGGSLDRSAKISCAIAREVRGAPDLSRVTRPNASSSVRALPARKSRIAFAGQVKFWRSRESASRRKRAMTAGSVFDFFGMVAPLRAPLRESPRQPGKGVPAFAPSD